MRVLGAIVMIVGMLIAIIGIQQTAVIHSYNMSEAAVQGSMRSDIFAIIAGIAGFAVLVGGWIVFMLKRKQKVTK